MAILERVQSGLIGATVSSFGITGLYITFVFGIGRFLRLSASNMRIRIPYTEMPDTSRLVALCQVPSSRAQNHFFCLPTAVGCMLCGLHVVSTRKEHVHRQLFVI